MIKYSDLSQFRIDRMDKIELLDEPRRELAEDFNMEKYTQKVFSMYNGELREVELIMDNSLIDVAIDRFGKKVRLTRFDDEHFSVKVSLSISPTFFSWLFQFGDKVKIVSPQEIKEDLKAHTTRFLENLQ